MMAKQKNPGIPCHRRGTQWQAPMQAPWIPEHFGHQSLPPVPASAAINVLARLPEGARCLWILPLDVLGSPVETAEGPEHERKQAENADSGDDQDGENVHG